MDKSQCVLGMFVIANPDLGTREELFPNNEWGIMQIIGNDDGDILVGLTDDKAAAGFGHNGDLSVEEATELQKPYVQKRRCRYVSAEEIIPSMNQD